MKDFKVTVTGETGTISYDVYKTEKGARSFGKKLANEAFYGEDVVITLVALQWVPPIWLEKQYLSLT